MLCPWQTADCECEPQSHGLTSIRRVSRCTKILDLFKDDELLQINPGFRKCIMHLNPGVGTRQNEEEGADSGVNETVET